MSKTTLPAPLVVILGLAAGVLEFLNSYSIHWAAGSAWKPAITYGLIAIGVFLVSPLVGSAWKTAFDTFFHVSPAVASGISIVGTLIAAALNTFDISGLLKAILLAVVAFLQFVGFGPASVADLAAKYGFTRSGTKDELYKNGPKVAQ
jgi:hypothetical protein